ncbi:hypothetical protein [Cetobacterium sp.]|jgi:hypothetical protein|uniref:hypothetical protein n=1 Tax=Cetobacterium sp. TaxID=2071632 RepID=UPI002FC6B311
MSKAKTNGFLELNEDNGEILFCKLKEKEKISPSDPSFERVEEIKINEDDFLNFLYDYLEYNYGEVELSKPFGFKNLILNVKLMDK